MFKAIIPLLCSVLVLLAQAPPIQRNYYTTNSNPGNVVTSAPASTYVNFGAYTNIGPAPIFKGFDDQGYVTVGGASNVTFISNGVFSSWYQNVASPVAAASYIWTTNTKHVDFMWMRGRYKNVSPSGVAAPLAVMICGNRSFDNSGVAGVWNPVWQNLTHVVLRNGEVDVQLWDSGGGIVYQTNFYFFPGWGLSEEERVFGFYYGDGTLTCFGYGMDGLRGVTVSNSLFNTFRPTNGAPSYLAWETYLGTASSNLLYNIEFTEIGSGNDAALNILLPQWNEQFRNTSLYVKTGYGTASNLTVQGTFTNSGNLRVFGTAFDANGNPYSTNSGGGVQTPWAQGIDASSYPLTNVQFITVQEYVSADYVTLYPDSNEVGLAISPLTGAGNPVVIRDTNYNTKFMVTPDGKVAVGTNAATATLEVHGGVVVSGGVTNYNQYTANILRIDGSLNFNGVNSFSQYGMDMGGAFNGTGTKGITRINAIAFNTNQMNDIPVLVRQPGTNYALRIDSGVMLEAFTVSTQGLARAEGFVMSTNRLSLTGPANITNGLSAFWNSNGLATYLRTGPAGYTTNKDTLIATH